MTSSRRVSAVVIALVAAATLTSCTGGTSSTTDAHPSPTTSTSTSTDAPTSTTPGTASPRRDRGPQPLPASPDVHVTALTIPAVGIKTERLEDLALLNDGSLAAPHNPDRAGWFADGATPGDVGPAVIAGHVDSTTGPAVFYNLRRVEPGDTVTVGLSNGSHIRFHVDRVATTPKKSFPTDTVFGPTPDAELRLITCSGRYDPNAGYLDNTIVFATSLTAAGHKDA